MKKKNYRFSDIVDIPKLQNLANKMYAATAISYGITTKDGETLVRSGWQRICLNFHRQHPKANEECIESNRNIRKEISEGASFTIYECPHGLIDAAAPVFIEGEHVANVFAGQFFTQSPDDAGRQFFLEQAKRFAFDEKEYMAALQEIPVLPESKVRPILDFLADFAELIATIGLARKRELAALEKLRESNEFNQQIIRSVREGIVVYGRDMRFQVWNPSMEEFTGLPASQVVGKHSSDFLEDTMTVEAVRKSLAGETPAPFDVAYTFPSGKVCWKTHMNVPLRDTQGEVIGVIATVLDITERKQAEEALRTSEYKFKSIYSQSPIGIEMYDSDGRLIDLNPACLAIFGIDDMKEVLGFNIYEDPNLSEEIKKQVRNGKEVRYEFEFNFDLVKKHGLYKTTKSGSAWLDCLITPLLIEEGKIGGYLISILDVTERKEAEEGLRKSEERMRFFFERQIVGMAITSPERGWLKVNDTLCQMLGYTREELNHLTWSELTHPDDLPGNIAQFERVLSGEVDEYSLDKRFIRKDGTIVYTTLSVGSVRHSDGSLDYLLALLTDISERKRIENALKQAAIELARSNKDLERFAYIASHDLQEPLRSITTYLSLLRKNCPNEITAKMEEMISFSEEAATRMRTMINDLLTYSRVGRQGKTFESIDMQDLLNRVLSGMKATIAESAASISYDPLPHIIADRALIGQVLQNFIVNAIKICEDKKPTVHIGYQISENEWIFLIRDNGNGISPEFHERIFQVFQRLHTQTEYKGTGIGLAICKRIVEHHGGRIWLESEAGRGSTFFFSLPKRNGALLSPPPGEDDRRGCRSHT